MNNSKIITTGFIRIFHDEEKTKLKEEYFIHINKKEGIYRSYWKNGQLEDEVNYINGKREGIKKHIWKMGNYALK